jgi:hypothetical protein
VQAVAAATYTHHTLMEKLEYDVYKNENDAKIKKLITLDDYFEISIIKNKMI